jgi:ketose-bisphosphate aldolase
MVAELENKAAPSGPGEGLSMPLGAIGSMLGRAMEGRYALGYFESWNLESLQGVVDAAEEASSPVILGFNGSFLSGPRRANERLAVYGALGRAAAISARVPCGLIFNECPRDDWVVAAMDHGFNLVMLADPAADRAQLIDRVTTLARLAHSRGIAVEAEVGELPLGAGASDHPAGGALTDPAEAAEFVEATGVDLLAVSVGNVHILTAGEEELDLGLLEEIHRRVPVPLVLHGGTGIGEKALREAISVGVAKVNFGTYLKQRYASAIRAALGHECRDPHRQFGLGGPEDVLVAGRLAVRDAVLERIDWLGCRGKAL